MNVKIISVGAALILDEITVTKLTDIRVIRELGSGFECTTFLATWKDHTVVLRGDSLSNFSEFNQSIFDQSTKWWVQLNHPSIAKCYGVWDRFQVLEYLVSPVDQLSASDERHLKSAIQYLENLGMAHSDIKKSNMMRDSQGNIKLIDFGSMQRIDVSLPSSDYMALKLLFSKCARR